MLKSRNCPNCLIFAIVGMVITALFLLVITILLIPRLIAKHEFAITSASAYQKNEYILIDADVHMDFSSEVVEALENGIPLILSVELQVLRSRAWWTDEIIKDSKQYFQLRYHPLTEIHEIKNLERGVRYNFKSREDALKVLGTIRGAQLIAASTLLVDEIYYAKMRTLIDTSRLPAALRQVASLSPAWRLESKWYQWQLN